MTKYSKKALDAAKNSVAVVINQYFTDRAVVTAVFDTLERAPWWEEVTDGNTVVPAGQPYRCEFTDGLNVEGIAAGPLSPDNVTRLFRDTRWTPPRPTPKVGDVIEECTDETLPVDGVGLVDALGTVAQISDDTIMWTNRGEDEWSSLLQRHLPITVIYVPKAGGDE